MHAVTLHLAAPSHGVEPTLLAQRLPTLAQCLAGFTAVHARTKPAPLSANPVRVYAAQLGVQRDHVTLESLPPLSGESREALSQVAHKLAAEFANDDLVFTPHGNGAALGQLNVSIALAPAANFIGRDISKALPRSDDAKILRQFVNAAQMTLHQSPLAACAVNSLWLAHALPSDGLAKAWLESGLTAWWDALPAWDAALDVAALSTATQLNLVFSDVTLSLALKRRVWWGFWTKPLSVDTLLQAAAATTDATTDA